MTKLKKHDIFAATVDGRTFTLEPAGGTPAPATGARSYDVMRDGEKVARVDAKGTSFYYVFRTPSSELMAGYVQHNRAEAIWSAALLVARGLEPLKPAGADRLREIASKPR